MNKYDYLLQHFVDESDLRPAMTQPCTIGNYTYATDAHAVIRIPKELPAFEYKPLEKYKYPDIESVLKKDNCNEKFSINCLYSAIGKFRFTYEKEPCEYCNGTGSIHCEYCEHDHDCEHCENGTSEAIKPNQLQKKSFDVPYSHIMINGASFRPYLIDRLLKSAFIEGVEEIVIKRSFNGEINHFVIGKISVYLMPRSYNEADIERAEKEEYFEIPTIKL